MLVKPSRYAAARVREEVRQGFVGVAANFAEGDNQDAGGEGSQRLFDKPQASEVLFGPTSPYRVAGEGVAGEVTTHERSKDAWATTSVR